MKFTVLLLAAAGVSAMPIPMPQRRSDVEAATDKLAFKTSLSDFQKAAAAAKKTPGDGLDWSTDGCSSAPQNPLGFQFRPACERHDFGYRNYVAQGRMDKDQRKKIDKQFKTDLLGQCDKVQEGDGKGGCQILADGYYQAVRLFGGSHAKPKNTRSDKEEAADEDASEDEGSTEEAAEPEAAATESKESGEAAAEPEASDEEAATKESGETVEPESSEEVAPKEADEEATESQESGEEATPETAQETAPESSDEEAVEPQSTEETTEEAAPEASGEESAEPEASDEAASEESGYSKRAVRGDEFDTRL